MPPGAGGPKGGLKWRVFHMKPISTTPFGKALPRGLLKEEYHVSADCGKLTEHLRETHILGAEKTCEDCK